MTLRHQGGRTPVMVVARLVEPRLSDSVLQLASDDKMLKPLRHSCSSWVWGKNGE